MSCRIVVVSRKPVVREPCNSTSPVVPTGAQRMPWVSQVTPRGSPARGVPVAGRCRQVREASTVSQVGWNSATGGKDPVSWEITGWNGVAGRALR